MFESVLLLTKNDEFWIWSSFSVWRYSTYFFDMAKIHTYIWIYTIICIRIFCCYDVNDSDMTPRILHLHIPRYHMYHVLFHQNSHHELLIADPACDPNVPQFPHSNEKIPWKCGNVRCFGGRGPIRFQWSYRNRCWNRWRNKKHW